MKPYIMQYSETHTINDENNVVVDSTRKTFTIESDDKDYFSLEELDNFKKVNTIGHENSVNEIPFNPELLILKYCTNTIMTKKIENTDNSYCELI